MMVDRTPKIATLLRQKPAAEGRIQGIGRHPTEAALDALRDRMEVLRDRMEALRAIRMLCVNAWMHSGVICEGVIPGLSRQPSLNRADGMLGG
jgi:hypothetical protein